MRLFIAVCIVLYVMNTTVVWSHGTLGSVVESETYLVTAEYDDGEPMNYAEINITAPGLDVPFQTGRTDLLGHFSFKPDRPGKWAIEVLDGEGHRLALDLTVDDDFKVNEYDNTTGIVYGGNKFVKAITGISLIFGMAGVLYGWKARRLINHVQEKGVRKI